MGSSNDDDGTFGNSGYHGQNIMNMAHQLFQQQGGINGSWINFAGADVNENMTGAWDKLAESGALTSAGDQLMETGGQLTGQLGTALEALKKGSQEITTYDVQSTRDAYLKDKEKFLTENDAAIQNQLQNTIGASTNKIYGGAAGQGNVGSSRAQLAVGQATGDLASNAQNLMAQQRSQAYDQALTQANNQLGGNRTAQLQAAQQGISAVTSGMNYMQQGAGLHNQAIGNQLQAGLQQYQTQMQQAQINYQNLMGKQNAGWQNLGMFNNVITGWSGAGQQQNQGPTDGEVALGLGAAVIGAMSDSRLKTNIEKIGHTDRLGLNIYKWEWNEKAKDLPKHMIDYNQGYIAQEVAELYPDYVNDYDGYLTVDYDGLGQL